MNDILKQDVFFIVTTIAVAAVGIVLIVAVVYLIRILRDVRDVTERVNEESRALQHDIGALRSSLRRDGFSLSVIYGFLKKLFRSRSTRTARKKEDGET